MFEIFKDHIKYAPDRKDYHIKWNIEFSIDRTGGCQCWALLPTVVWVPWYYRHRGCSIFDIIWFNWHITIGEWMFGRKGDKDGI